MPEIADAYLAPCVAVIGPANAGKTTLLHQLDERLKQLSDAFLVIKGNPDGTGRYQYHSPELRHDEEFKKSIKGKWGDATVERICEWITHGRKNLSLALLDFGGRHDAQTAEGNERMLRCCSHYLLVARETDPEGAAFWDEIGRSHGLIRLGSMKSLPFDGPGGAPASVGEGGIAGAFQVDVLPGDARNDPALVPLVELLYKLSRPADRIPYVNLHQARDWTRDQIDDVAGQEGKIAELASKTGVVVLGGAAPIWAYLAGLRCAMAARPDVRVFFYDPKQPERLVEIPAKPSGNSAPAFPAGALRVWWRDDGGRSTLQFELAEKDKFLPPAAAQNLADAPPVPARLSDDICLNGAWPTWIAGTYARWLVATGVRRLATWDGRSKDYVQVWG